MTNLPISPPQPHLPVWLCCLPDGCSVVALCPPGLWWVEVPTPQLPVEALGGQRVLLDLEGVVLDVVKGGRHHSSAVLLYPLQDGFCPVGKENQRRGMMMNSWHSLRFHLTTNEVQPGGMRSNQISPAAWLDIASENDGGREQWVSSRWQPAGSWRWKSSDIYPRFKVNISED